MFRVLRRSLGNGGRSVHVFIVSAKYGLISGSAAVPIYDERLTLKKALKLRLMLPKQWAELPEASVVTTMLVAVGSEYRIAVGPLLAGLSESVHLDYIGGAIGSQCGQLSNWLSGHQLEPPDVGESVQFRGLTLRASAADLQRVAEELFARSRSTAQRFEHWYVDVGGLKIAPKVLLSEMTGIPVSAFRTADALRVLRGVGADVRMVNRVRHYEPDKY